MIFLHPILITGSSGLIGSEVVSFFAHQGYAVHGVDNNQREVFFGPQGSTSWNQQRLKEQYPSFIHHDLDIRDRSGVLELNSATAPRGYCAYRRTALSRPRCSHSLR